MTLASPPFPTQLQVTILHTKNAQPNSYAQICMPCFRVALYSPTDLRQRPKKLLWTCSCLSVSQKNTEPHNTCKIFTYDPSDTHCINFGNFYKSTDTNWRVWLVNWQELYQKSAMFYSQIPRIRVKSQFVRNKSLLLVFCSSTSLPDGKNFIRFLWDWF